MTTYAWPSSRPSCNRGSLSTDAVVPCGNWMLLGAACSYFLQDKYENPGNGDTLPVRWVFTCLEWDQASSASCGSSCTAAYMYLVNVAQLRTLNLPRGHWICVVPHQGPSCFHYGSLAARAFQAIRNYQAYSWLLGKLDVSNKYHGFTHNIEASALTLARAGVCAILTKHSSIVPRCIAAASIYRSECW